MKIDVATQHDIYAVARAMRERDFAEFSAVSTGNTRDEVAGLLAQRFADREDVVCAALDEPIAIIGMLETRPRVVSLLFLATDRFPEIVRPVVRIYRQIFDRLEADGIHRFEAVSLDGYTFTHKFLGLFGLSAETGPMSNYGKNGEAFVQFSRTRR